MFKLSGEAAGVAWEDYKAHLRNLGFIYGEDDPQYKIVQNLNLERIAHMAFKQGFAQGSAKATTTIANAVHIEPERLKKARKISNRTARTLQQRLQDRLNAEEVLQENIEPMPLWKIINEMHKKGSNHWNNSNASSYMRQAIDDGGKISWLGRGMYAFDFGGEK